MMSDNVIAIGPQLEKAAERKRAATARTREADRALLSGLGLNPDLADWRFEVREDGSVERVYPEER